MGGLREHIGMFSEISHVMLTFENANLARMASGAL